MPEGAQQAGQAVTIELMAALSLARAPVSVSTLKRRVTVTQHESRIGLELRNMERDGIARFTHEGGWQLVPRDVATGTGA